MYSSDLGCADCKGECGLGYSNIVLAPKGAAPGYSPTGATRAFITGKTPVVSTVLYQRPGVTIPSYFPPVIAKPTTVVPKPTTPVLWPVPIDRPPLLAILPTSGQGGGGGPTSGGTVTMPTVNQGMMDVAASSESSGFSPVMLLAAAAAGFFLLAAKNKRR